ncbi:uncharacterized protein LOC120342820 [Styela clava]
MRPKFFVVCLAVLIIQLHSSEAFFGKVGKAIGKGFKTAKNVVSKGYEAYTGKKLTLGNAIGTGMQLAEGKVPAPAPGAAGKIISAGADLLKKKKKTNNEQEQSTQDQKNEKKKQKKKRRKNKKKNNSRDNEAELSDYMRAMEENNIDLDSVKDAEKIVNSVDQSMTDQPDESFGISELMKSENGN